LEAKDRFVEALEKFIESGELIEIHCVDKDGFEVGFVKSVSTEVCSISSVSAFGLPDGSVLIQLSSIERMVVRSEYLVALQLLHHRHLSGVAIPSQELGGFDSLFNGLLHAFENHILISVTNDSGTVFTGYVKNITQEHIELLLITREGFEDGMTALALESIYQVDSGNPIENTRAYLYKNRMGL
jgi:hypothetical protein